MCGFLRNQDVPALHESADNLETLPPDLIRAGLETGGQLLGQFADTVCSVAAPKELGHQRLYGQGTGNSPG